MQDDTFVNHNLDIVTMEKDKKQRDSQSESAKD